VTRLRHKPTLAHHCWGIASESEIKPGTPCARLLNGSISESDVSDLAPARNSAPGVSACVESAQILRLKVPQAANLKAAGCGLFVWWRAAKPNIASGWKSRRRTQKSLELLKRKSPRCRRGSRVTELTERLVCRDGGAVLGQTLCYT